MFDVEFVLEGVQNPHQVQRGEMTGSALVFFLRFFLKAQSRLQTEVSPVQCSDGQALS